MRSVPRTPLLVIIIGMAITGSAFLGFWFGTRITTIRQWQDRANSKSHFRRIRRALLNYHNEYERFPPTKYQLKPNGPIHSWRVLVSPYAGPHDEKLYSNYDFSEAWNSPGNLAVARSLWPRSLPFSMKDNNFNFANYLAVGEGDKWPTWPLVGHLNALLVTTDGDRFLLVEDPASGIYWTRPRY